MTRDKLIEIIRQNCIEEYSENFVKVYLPEIADALLFQIQSEINKALLISRRQEITPFTPRVWDSAGPDWS